MQREKEHNMLYLYVSKDNEHVLVEKFQKTAEAVLGLQIYGKLDTFVEFFEQMMIYGKEHHFTLVFDEFQNFLKVNDAIPGHIQEIWDRYHNTSKVNLIACGSIYNMMKKIFDNEDEPLYGRKDCDIKLMPFRISVIKQILGDYNPRYQPEDLLCLYMLTGGVAKYVGQLMDVGATTKDAMLRRNIRWYIDDCFLRFWFRFILPNQALVEVGRNELLYEIVENDYCDYSGHILEHYFRQKYREEERVTTVGRYWDRKGTNEIDLIALDYIDKKAVVAEVKRNSDKYDSTLLNNKYQTIKSEFGRYREVQLIGLSMFDM